MARITLSYAPSLAPNHGFFRWHLSTSCNYRQLDLEVAVKQNEVVYTRYIVDKDRPVEFVTAVEYKELYRVAEANLRPELSEEAKDNQMMDFADRYYVAQPGDIFESVFATLKNRFESIRFIVSLETTT